MESSTSIRSICASLQSEGVAWLAANMRQLLTAYVLIILLLLVTSCNGSQDSQDSLESPTPSPPESPAPIPPVSPPPTPPVSLTPGLPLLIVGTAPSGLPQNLPTNWSLQAGNWNGKAASYNAATDRIVFESFRADIQGGSITDPAITATGVMEYYVAGPGTGTNNISGTSVLYIANSDGTNPVCIGCTDVVDGQNGVAIYKVLPSTTTVPNAIVRQVGAIVYANQNKDLATWYPEGSWVLAGVEMPRHALTHALGNSEIGIFNDLWAISADGRTWVQLTDYARTWTHQDPVARMPYACADIRNCPLGCQYEGSTPSGAVHPYRAYSCSAAGVPPPASGTLRPKLSNRFSGDVPGSVKLILGERVGLSPVYTWGGVLQLAMADVLLSGGLPALVNYEQNLTPTPSDPDGQLLWSNPGGNTVIGAGYEPWSFSEDDSVVTFASDVFLSTSDPAVSRTTSPISQAFTDAIAWNWRRTPSTLTNITRFDAQIYPYVDNAAPLPLSRYGHWEEPIIAFLSASRPFFAFASSANLTPTWNPLDSNTFGLETWVVPADRSAPAMKITRFNEPATAPRTVVYPTAASPTARVLYLSVVPGLARLGTNAPGAIYMIVVPPL